jgi:hypothetical protein
MWADVTEEEQMKHLRHTKEQMEYVRINAEYESIKKRAVVNFLTNEKLNLESHFHTRTLNMLRSIQNFEQQNMRNHLKAIATGSLLKVTDSIKSKDSQKDILR